jgi:hypothetical protein
MSWLLKQAEDILNRVDQQTNAAINQHHIQSTPKQTDEESKSDSPSINSTNKSTRNLNSTNLTTTTTGNRRNKKSDDSDLIDYLNSSTSTNNKSNRTVPFNNSLSDTTRAASSPDMLRKDSLKATESSSQSTSNSPRSTTPAVQTHDEDEGLVLVRFLKKSSKFFIIN